jgi:hypothetical protein
MSCIDESSEGSTTPQTSTLADLVVGTGVGALLGASYGALVAGVHFIVHGRWDKGPAFALGATVASAALGLVAGTVSALFRRRPVRPASPATAPTAEAAPSPARVPARKAS